MVETGGSSEDKVGRGSSHSLTGWYPISALYSLGSSSLSLNSGSFSNGA